MATVAADWGISEQVLVWVEATEAVVEDMLSRLEVEVMEVEVMEVKVEWCMEEVWAEVPGPW